MSGRRALGLLAGAGLLLGSVSLLGSGLPPAPTASAAAPMIVDGDFTESAPWAARLYQDGEDGYCTASVISPEWILTARHCVQEQHRWGFRIGDV